MEDKVKNMLGSERTIEVKFIEESLKNYTNKKVLDVGGIPTDSHQMESIYDCIENNEIDFRISDFRSHNVVLPNHPNIKCNYPGDFVQYDFKDEKFDMVIFLSSLEHFPQCTESDRVYREGYDIKGYEKALSILNEEGIILLTVPFGKYRWQKYHQNYNMGGILKLTKGSEMIESYTYELVGESNPVSSVGNGVWEIRDPKSMEEIIYSDRAYGVGCFVLKKIQL